MRRYRATGSLELDILDVILLAWVAGGTLSFLSRQIKNRKFRRQKRDSLAIDLERQSRSLMITEQGKAIPVATISKISGGAEANKGASLFQAMVKNRRFARFLRLLLVAKEKERQFKLLRIFFFTFNSILTTGGIRVAVGGNLDLVQLILIIFPSSLAGFILERLIENPVVTVMLPITALYARGIEDIDDTSEKCRQICQAAEKIHNKRMLMEMKEIVAPDETQAMPFSVPSESAAIECVESKLSLTQRYRLKQLLKGEKTRRQVQHFSEFIKKFPECDPNEELVSQEIMQRISELAQ